MTIPKLDKRIVMITSSYPYSAVVSSYFNEPDSYVSIFKIFDDPDKDSESRISRMQTERQRIYVTNKIVMIQPQYVVLAGMSSLQKALFSNLSSSKVILLDSLGECEAQLGKIKDSHRGELRSNLQDLYEALLLAKNSKLKLTLDENAAKIPSTTARKQSLIVVEGHCDTENVIAANYAFAVNADLITVKEPSAEDLKSVKADLAQWGETGSIKARSRITKVITERISTQEADKYENATFFTDGLPYSFGLKNSTPATHVFRKSADHLIVDNLLYEEHGSSFNSALIFSPKVFSNEESDQLAAALKEKGVFTKKLFDDEATIRNFSTYGTYFPFDILHICTHGGRLPGIYTIFQFKDRKGAEHTVEMIVVSTFSQADDHFDEHGEPMIEVVSQYIYQKFDGADWMSSDLENKELPRYVWEDFENALFSRAWQTNVIETWKTDDVVLTSRYVHCNDGPHQAMFNYLAGQSTPIVFNNSCHSWFEIAEYFISLGAKSYIGTLWAINNDVAFNSSLIFYKHFLKGESLLESFTRMTKAIDIPSEQNIYILWGLHFTKMHFREEVGGTDVLTSLLRQLDQMVTKMHDPTKEEEIHLNCLDAVKRIVQVIEENFEQRSIQSRIPKEILSMTEAPPRNREMAYDVRLIERDQT